MYVRDGAGYKYAHIKIKTTSDIKWFDLRR
jgi:hypothetical protein